MGKTDKKIWNKDFRQTTYIVRCKREIILEI